MTQEMTAMEQIHEGMIRRAQELHRLYVLSNFKMRQMESAKSTLKKMVANNGDTGMGYVMDMIEEKYKEEKCFNSNICTEYYHYIEFVNSFEKNARDYGIGCLWDVYAKMDAHTMEIREEAEEVEQKAIENYCK